MAVPTPKLGLARPDHGDFPDTWEIPVNSNMDILDAVFDGVRSDGLGTGHIHDGTDGQGPHIEHGDLLDIGTKTHATLEAQQGLGYVSAGDTTLGYLEDKIVAGTNVVITKVNPGADEDIQISVPTATGTPVGNPNDPSGSYGWKSFVPTSAGVSYTDNFNYVPSFQLQNAGYASSFWSSTGGFDPELVSTGYAAHMIIDPTRGDALRGRNCYTALCHIPHGAAQRATINLTDIDYANMHAGDAVAFTLHLYATHTLGPTLPPKYGVMLEVHFTKLTDAPDTYQVSHRVIVIPDDVTQIQLFEHHHSDPEAVKGCWEISLDTNGHVYHYYRRHLVFSTQPFPPSSPGPVQPYFASLTASLLALGDPPYGAIGFGCQYDIRPDSQFEIEMRWFSLNGVSDLYDMPGLPDSYPTLGPTVVDVPDAFWDEPPPGPPPPGEICCPDPPGPLVTVGDAAPGGGIVTGCNQVSIFSPDPNIHYAGPGFHVDGSPNCEPCPVMIPIDDTPDDGLVPIDSGTDPEGDWVRGTSGLGCRDGRVVTFFIENRLNYLPPAMEIISSDPTKFSIIHHEWIDYRTVQVVAEVAPGTGATDITLTIRSARYPAKTIDLVNYIHIYSSAAIITSVSFTDPQMHDTASTPKTFVPDYDFTLTGSRFDPAAVITSTLGIAVASTVNDTTISGTLDYSGLTIPATDTITVTNPGQSTTDFEVDVGIKPIEATVGQIDSFAIGATGSASYNAPFLTGLPVVLPGPPVAANNLRSTPDIAYVQYTNVVFTTPTLSFDYEILAPTPPGTELWTEVEDPNTGFTTLIPLCTANDPGSVHSISGVITDVSPIIGRKVLVSAQGALFAHDVFMSLTGLAWTGLNSSAGYLRNYTRTPNLVSAYISLDPVDVGAVVGVTVSAGLFPVVPTRSDTFGTAFTVLAVPALSFVGDTWGGGVFPGDTGTLSVIGTGFTDVPGEIEVTSDSSLITLTPGSLTIVSSIQFTIDYEISAEADGELAQQITVTQNLDSSTFSFTEGLGAQPPVITLVEFGGPVEILRTMDVTITGTGFDVFPFATVVLGSGSVTVNSIVSQTTTEIVANITFSGAVAPFTLQVKNTDLQTDDYVGTTEGQTDVLVRHGISRFSDGKIYTGLPTTIDLYGDNLNAPGATFDLTPEAVLTGPVVNTRTHAEVPVNVVGAAGTEVSVTITTTTGGPYGPFFVGSVEAPPVLVEVTGVSTTLLAENTNHPTWEVYGANLNLIDQTKTLIVFRNTGTPWTDEEKAPVVYIPKGGTPPVVINSTVVTAPKLTFDIDLDADLQARWFSVILRDSGSVVLYTIESAFKAAPFTNDILVISEDHADLTANVTGSATYDMEIPVVSTPPFDAGDVITAVGATVNTQTFDALATPYPVWRLNVTNDAGPGYIEFTIDRVGLGGDPPYGTKYVPLGGSLI